MCLQTLCSTSTQGLFTEQPWPHCPLVQTCQWLMKQTQAYSDRSLSAPAAHQNTFGPGRCWCDSIQPPAFVSYWLTVFSRPLSCLSGCLWFSQAQAIRFSHTDTETDKYDNMFSLLCLMNINSLWVETVFKLASAVAHNDFFLRRSRHRRGRRQSGASVSAFKAIMHMQCLLWPLTGSLSCSVSTIKAFTPDTNPHLPCSKI